MNLLSRQAESLFWLGRYIERATSLARVLQVQTAFDRGRTGGSSWAWLLALYDESQDFYRHYEDASNQNVIRYFFADKEHPGSVLRTLEAARSNARALRAMISTELWMHANQSYRRVQNLPEEALSETRLAATCQSVQVDCYALEGIANATLYRDAGWRFYQLGLDTERADQMSRLLDVRFAQLMAGDAAEEGGIGDFTHWSMLLRACGGHHAYRRLVSGPLQSQNVARFLIFEQSFARSIAYCVGGLERSVNELRSICSAPPSGRVADRINRLITMLQVAQGDPGLVKGLHQFNDAVQRQLIGLTDDLGACYFGIDAEEISVDEAPTSVEPDWIVVEDDPVGADASTAKAADAAHAEGPATSATSAKQSQSQSQEVSPTQSQSQDQT